MNNIQKRFLLFLCGCILVRTLFVIIVKNNPQYLQLFGLVALIPAIGFFYIYFSNSRKTGQEVLGEKIWWDNLRPIHGFLYALFAVMALNKNYNSWIVLLLDVIIGLVAFLTFHYQEGNFKYLLE
jgi:hypothetical protein